MMSDPESASQGISARDPLAGDGDSSTERDGPQNEAGGRIRKDETDLDAGMAKGNDRKRMDFSEAMEMFVTPQKLEEAVLKRGRDEMRAEELRSPREADKFRAAERKINGKRKMTESMTESPMLGAREETMAVIDQGNCPMESVGGELCKLYATRRETMLNEAAMFEENRPPAIGFIDHAQWANWTRLWFVLNSVDKDKFVHYRTEKRAKKLEGKVEPALDI